MSDPRRSQLEGQNYNDRTFPLRLDRGEGQGEVAIRFGLRLRSTINSPQSTDIGKWIERFEEWLADSGFFERAVK